LAVTHDGGNTWNSLGVVGTATVGCDVAINPANSQDLIVHTVSIGNVSDSWRSLDGGHIWTELNARLPGTGYQLVTYAWAGTTLYGSAHIPGTATSPPSRDRLVVSVNNGLFMFADQQLSFNGLSIENIVVDNVGNRLVVTALLINPGSSDTPIMFASTDVGATWTPWPFSVAGKHIYYYYHAGAALVGTALGASTNYLSFDQGQTWQVFPNEPSLSPQGDFLDEIFASSPSGTVYTFAEASTQDEVVLYRWRAGDKAWTVVHDQHDKRANVVRPFFLSWDSSGHPTRIWGLKDSLSGDFSTYVFPVTG
jgi:hypothetical protein